MGSSFSNGSSKSLDCDAFLSTSDSTRDLEEAYDLNANAYLTKPNTMQGLKVIVNRIHQFWLDIAKLPALI